jgi:hypothetical protein
MPLYSDAHRTFEQRECWYIIRKDRHPMYACMQSRVSFLKTRNLNPNARMHQPLYLSLAKKATPLPFPRSLIPP